MIGVLPVSLFSQQKKAIRPLATQNPVPEILPKESALNPEYEKALQEYEALIKNILIKKSCFIIWEILVT